MTRQDALERAARGAALLKQGHYREGFPLFDEWRRTETANTAPMLPFRRWQGEPVAGKRVLIWGEHGFGDQIMYARFARILASGGGEVSWLCDPALARLFASALGVTSLPADRSHDLACDYYCPSSALPLGFDLSPETVPNATYLFAAGVPSAGRVGLMLAASAANPERSLTPDLARRLTAETRGVSLDPAATGARDFYDTAQIVGGLDLVITVDTAVAHLAGAMGKPTLVLLPFDADWRWLTGRSDSPWYPSATLYRQAADRRWAPVVERLIAELPMHLAGGGAPPMLNDS